MKRAALLKVSKSNTTDLLHYRRQLSLSNTYYVPGALHTMGNIYCLPARALLQMWVKPFALAHNLV